MTLVLEIAAEEENKETMPFKGKIKLRRLWRLSAQLGDRWVP